ncbi:MAG: magnesium transporter [Evtepia gabavorous]
MLSATLTSMVLTGYETSLAACSALIAFIPMLTGTGGNSGTQASVAVIRGLSLGEVEFSDTFRVVWKEIRVAVLCGVTLAACNFVKLMVVDRFLLHNEGVTVLVAAVICVTMVFTVLCAKAVGCLLPLLAERIHLDPAVMASPFISTVVDVVTLVLYCQVARAIRHI